MKIQNIKDFLIKIFGNLKYSFYLCTVITSVLAIRVESRGGQDFFDTVLGARHHENYSTFKNHPTGWFYRS